MSEQYIWTGPRDLRAGKITIKSMVPFEFDGALMKCFGGLIHSSPNRLMTVDVLRKRASRMGKGNLKALLARAGFDVFGGRDQLEKALNSHLDGIDIAEEKPKPAPKPKKAKSKAKPKPASDEA